MRWKKSVFHRKSTGRFLHGMPLNVPEHELRMGQLCRWVSVAFHPFRKLVRKIIMLANLPERACLLGLEEQADDAWSQQKCRGAWPQLRCVYVLRWNSEGQPILPREQWALSDPLKELGRREFHRLAMIFWPPRSRRSEKSASANVLNKALDVICWSNRIFLTSPGGDVFGPKKFI